MTVHWSHGVSRVQPSASTPRTTVRSIACAASNTPHVVEFFVA
ncbi:hypothetical protein QM693_03545 [Rhodococcus sp. IEGM 1305]|nr:hypothetical protein [Rhodococcus sp. IEGM 1305]MDI9948217.1 hypothetical protein [Rhodococcus sp. IEGM 1305]